jgi:hypothetical protein
MPVTRHAINVLLVLALVTSSGLAWAEGSSARDRARALFEEGLGLIDDERWDEALERFDRSLELYATAAAVLNRAMCLSLLGRNAEALAAFEAYLAEHGERAGRATRRRISSETRRLEGLVGRLDVSMEQAVDAQLVVDGEVAGALPLPRPLPVSPGEHRLELRAEGRAPHRAHATVAAGETARVRVPRGALPRLGAIEVQIDLSGVQVSIDGEAAGETPLDGPIPVAPGPHTVSGVRAGYDIPDATVDVAEGEDAIAVLRPGRSDSTGGAAARLAIDVSEPGAEVLLDGAPLEAESVPPGHHVLEVSREGFRPWRDTVEAVAGETTPIAVTLVPTDERRESYEARARAFRIGGWTALGVGMASLATSLALLLWNEGRVESWSAEDLALGESYALLAGPGPEAEALAARVDDNNALARSIDGVDIACWSFAGFGLAVTAASLGLLFGGPDPNRYVRAAVAPTEGGAVGMLSVALR